MILNYLQYFNYNDFVLLFIIRNRNLFRNFQICNFNIIIYFPNIDIRPSIYLFMSISISVPDHVISNEQLRIRRNALKIRRNALKNLNVLPILVNAIGVLLLGVTGTDFIFHNFMVLLSFLCLFLYSCTILNQYLPLNQISNEFSLYVWQGL